jgi:hypothetical protein
VCKSIAISPTILMPLMMMKQATTCCAADVLNKDIQLETTEEFYNFKI